MASNHTENYGLNQWERTDKVLMEDFNADNAKIDALLAFHPSAELICTMEVTEENTNLLKLDISHVDWSRYFMLYLSLKKDIRGPVTITTDKDNGHGLRLHNTGGVGENTMSHFSEAMEVRSLFFVGYNGETTPVVLGVSACRATGNFSPQCIVSTGFVSYPYQELSELQVGGSDFGIGAKVELWGLK